jgi:hypothetical protein
VLRFPLPILIPPTAPHLSSSTISSEAGTVGQLAADVPRGLSPTSPQESITILLKLIVVELVKNSATVLSNWSYLSRDYLTYWLECGIKS